MDLWQILKFKCWLKDIFAFCGPNLNHLILLLDKKKISMNKDSDCISSWDLGYGEFQ